MYPVLPLIIQSYPMNINVLVLAPPSVRIEIL